MYLQCYGLCCLILLIYDDDVMGCIYAFAICLDFVVCDLFVAACVGLVCVCCFACGLFGMN